MEHFRGELHLWRTEGVVCWEDELRNKNTSLKWGTLWAAEGRERGTELLSHTYYISLIPRLPRWAWEYTYVIRASHSKKFSSDFGPATIPSGGF